MKNCVFTRIKYSINEIVKKVEESPKLYGYPLISLLFDTVEQNFKDYNSNQQDLILMRLIDSLERRRNLNN